MRGTDQTSLLYELYQTGMQNEMEKCIFWSEKIWLIDNGRISGTAKNEASSGVYQRLHENKWVQGECSLVRAELDKCIDLALKSHSLAEGEHKILFGG